MYEWMNKWINEWMNQWINKWLHHQMNASSNELWMSERINASSNQLWIREWMKVWMNVWMNEWMDGWSLFMKVAYISYFVYYFQYVHYEVDYNDMAMRKKEEMEKEKNKPEVLFHNLGTFSFTCSWLSLVTCLSRQTSSKYHWMNESGHMEKCTGAIPHFWTKITPNRTILTKLRYDELFGKNLFHFFCPKLHFFTFFSNFSGTLPDALINESSTRLEFQTLVK